MGKAQAASTFTQILPSGDPATWTLSTDKNKDAISLLLQNILHLFLLVAGGVAVIYLMIGAFNYLTAFGNEERASTGKKIITWAIVGIVVIVLAEFIIYTVWNFITPTPLNLP